MAKEYSFDITAKIDMQNFKNAINLVEREVTNRYDFKGTTFEVTFNEKAKTLVLIASSDNKLDALKDVVVSKFLKQGLSTVEIRNDISGNARMIRARKKSNHEEV